jgi:hypothetical protein
MGIGSRLTNGWLIRMKVAAPEGLERWVVLTINDDKVESPRLRKQATNGAENSTPETESAFCDHASRRRGAPT